jgi:hypothetical protein
VAEILVKATPAWTASAVPIIHQLGDVVAVRPDGWAWGAGECLPTFLIFKLPGTPVSSLLIEGPLMSVATATVPSTVLEASRCQIPAATVTAAVTAGVTKVVPPNAISFIGAIITKTS